MMPGLCWRALLLALALGAAPRPARAQSGGDASCAAAA
eukprot:COSAG04_NODE_111_length_25781_cov_90.291761_23_plen_37_part_01